MYNPNYTRPYKNNLTEREYYEMMNHPRRYKVDDQVYYGKNRVRSPIRTLPADHRYQVGAHDPYYYDRDVYNRDINRYGYAGYNDYNDYYGYDGYHDDHWLAYNQHVNPNLVTIDPVSCSWTDLSNAPIGEHNGTALNTVLRIAEESLAHRRNIPVQYCSTNGYDNSACNLDYGAACRSRYAPIRTTAYSPPRTHYSPPRTHYSPVRTHYSPVKTHYSPPRVVSPIRTSCVTNRSICAPIRTNCGSISAPCLPTSLSRSPCSPARLPYLGPVSTDCLSYHSSDSYLDTPYVENNYDRSIYDRVRHLPLPSYCKTRANSSEIQEKMLVNTTNIGSCFFDKRCCVNTTMRDRCGNAVVDCCTNTLFCPGQVNFRHIIRERVNNPNCVSKKTKIANNSASYNNAHSAKGAKQQKRTTTTTKQASEVERVSSPVEGLKTSNRTVKRTTVQSTRPTKTVSKRVEESQDETEVEKPVKTHRQTRVAAQAQVAAEPAPPIHVKKTTTTVKPTPPASLVKIEDLSESTEPEVAKPKVVKTTRVVKKTEPSSSMAQASSDEKVEQAAAAEPEVAKPKIVRTTRVVRTVSIPNAESSGTTAASSSKESLSVVSGEEKKIQGSGDEQAKKSEQSAAISASAEPEVSKPVVKTTRVIRKTIVQNPTGDAAGGSGETAGASDQQSPSTKVVKTTRVVKKTTSQESIPEATGGSGAMAGSTTTTTTGGLANEPEKTVKTTRVVKKVTQTPSTEGGATTTSSSTTTSSAPGKVKLSPMI